MAPSTIQYCISQLRSYPDLFARYGRTPFIHSRLYQENMPSPMQHAFTICVLNAGKSDLQRDMTYTVLNAEVHELLRAESSLSTFEDYLAHVQALILCQIVRLFDENVCQRTFAEQHDAVLAKWTDTLHEWKTWILMGSARRTVLMSHFLRGLYYARKTGVCSTVAVMADLPVSTRAVLWELESPTRWQLALKAAEPVLMPYKDYTTQWEEALNQNGSCAGEPSLCPSGYNYSTSNTASRYRLMRDALLAQNRTILYSLCDWGQAYVESWGNATGNSWRMSDDISPPFERILAILNENSFQLNATDFWGHNDADMLEVGNGISAAQTRSHFALWAAMKSPLIIGTDLSGVSDADVAVLKNAYLLAFNQDAEVGAPATPYKWGVNPDYTFNASFPAEYWSGESSNGTLVLVGNWLNETMSKVANYSEIPGLQAGGAYQVVDVWAGSSLGCVQNGVQINVEANDTAVYLIQEGCGSVIQKRRT
ncbi:MAG: hypothetical protein Q9157_005355 [Trypethelium eluteriae]